MLPPPLHQLPDLLEHISDACVALDSEWRYTYVNGRAAELLEQSRNSMLGRTIWELFPESANTFGQEALRRALLDRAPVEVEILSGRTSRWIAVRAFPAPDGLVVFFQDVHDRKVGEQEREALLAQVRAAHEELQVANEELQAQYEELASQNEELAAQEEELRTVYQELETIHGVADTLSAELDLDRLIQGLTDCAVQVAGARLGALVYHQLGERDQPEVLYKLSGVSQEVLAATFASSTHFFDSAARGGGVVRLEDLQQDPGQNVSSPFRALPEWEHAVVRSYMAVPVVTRSREVIGRLFLGHQSPGVFTAHHQRLIEGIAASAGTALENARLYRDVQETADALRWSEERYRSLVEATSHVIWKTDRDGLIQEDMPGWREITGKPLQSILGAGWLEDVHPDDRGRVREAWDRAFATRGIYSVEYRIRARDGEYRTLSVQGIPVCEATGELREWVGLAVDVTEQRRAEAQLRRQAAELAEADRRKDQFLAVLSHELRNPLAAVRAALHLLRVPDENTRERALGVLERQVSHQVRMVNDLLDVTRIRQAKIELDRRALDLTRLVEETVEDNREALESAGLTLQYTGPGSHLYVDGDPTRLAQVLGNVLANAAKFTPRGGTVRVTLADELATGGQAARAVVTIVDTGVGVPPEMVERIFEPFTQADRSLDRSQGGLGLGLALSRGILELHGGAISARSGGPGQGTELRIELPLTAAGPEKAAPSDTSGDSSEPLRILVVEDNSDAAETLRDLLELFGHRVEVARSGDQAPGAAERFRPQVVLCDIGLPGMDGYEVARHLRRGFRFQESDFRSTEPEVGPTAPDQDLEISNLKSEIPNLNSPVLVALTGYGAEEDRRRARAAGFDEHLTKPVDPAALELLLTRYSRTRPDQE